MKEKYLPIGTVVLLKEATKTLMITGYCSSTPDEPNTVYDYVAYLFPEGSLAGENVALFNHDQIGSVVYMGLVNDEFKNLEKVIKESVEAPAAPATPAAPSADANVNALPPFTPENINLMLQEIHKHEDELKPVEEPTAFDEEAIKKPVFELPSLDGGNKKEEKTEEEEEEEIPEEEESEESAPVEQEVVADGQPVLQLQPIFDGAASGDSTPVAPANGGLSGLSRL